MGIMYSIRYYVWWVSSIPLNDKQPGVFILNHNVDRSTSIPRTPSLESHMKIGGSQLNRYLTRYKKGIVAARRSIYDDYNLPLEANGQPHYSRPTHVAWRGQAGRGGELEGRRSHWISSSLVFSLIRMFQKSLCNVRPPLQGWKFQSRVVCFSSFLIGVNYLS